MRRVARSGRFYWLVRAGDLPGARCVLATWDADALALAWANGEEMA